MGLSSFPSRMIGLLDSPPEVLKFSPPLLKCFALERVCNLKDVTPQSGMPNEQLVNSCKFCILVFCLVKQMAMAFLVWTFHYTTDGNVSCEGTGAWLVAKGGLLFSTSTIYGLHNHRGAGKVGCHARYPAIGNAC